MGWFEAGIVKNFAFTSFIFALFSYAIPVDAANDFSIYKIFDRFVISNVAASQCYKPTPKELQDFQVQFLHVMISTSVELKKKKSDLSSDRVDNLLKRHADDLVLRVQGIIDKEGCDSKSIQELIALFKFHATLNLINANP